MRPILIDLSLETPALNNVCADQTTAGADDFDIDGSLASGGSVTLTTAHRLDIESTGNISGVTFTITGTDANGAALSEDVTGPNNATVTTTGYFLTITQVSVDGAVGTNTSIGTTDEAVSKTVPVNYRQRDFAIGLGMILSGTINASVQHTFDNVLAGDTPTWFTHDVMAALTSSDDGNYAFPIMAIRLLINSFSSGADAKLHALQAQ